MGNIAMVEKIATALGDLKEKMIFVGGSVKVDFMPDDENVLGFSNRWYADGIKNKQI